MLLPSPPDCRLLAVVDDFRPNHSEGITIWDLVQRKKLKQLGGHWQHIGHLGFLWTASSWPALNREEAWLNFGRWKAFSIPKRGGESLKTSPLGLLALNCALRPYQLRPGITCRIHIEADAQLINHVGGHANACEQATCWE